MWTTANCRTILMVETSSGQTFDHRKHHHYLCYHSESAVKSNHSHRLWVHSTFTIFLLTAIFEAQACPLTDICVTIPEESMFFLKNFWLEPRSLIGWVQHHFCGLANPNSQHITGFFEVKSSARVRTNMLTHTHTHWRKGFDYLRGVWPQQCVQHTVRCPWDERILFR